MLNAIFDSPYLEYLKAVTRTVTLRIFPSFSKKRPGAKTLNLPLLVSLMLEQIRLLNVFKGALSNNLLPF